MSATPLIDLHKALGANLGEFAHVKTAMDYGDPVSEHIAARTKVAIFDVSHMARIRVKGNDVLQLLDVLVPKALTELSPGVMFGPTAFLNEEAGFRDDVMVYPLAKDELMIVGNAVNRQKDYEWIGQVAESRNLSVEVEDITENTAMIAVQGPETAKYVQKLGLSINDIPWMNFRKNVRLKYGELLLVSRSGWTGEDGIEIIGEPDTVAEIFRTLVKMGAKPAGLIARDTLRIEMGFRLYGAEIDENLNPLEARYWVFTYGKKTCIGCTKLNEILRHGCSKQLVGLKMKKGVKFIPRHGYKLLTFDGTEEIGYITSGALSPTLNRVIALGYVKSSHAVMGLRVIVEIRRKHYPARIVDFPFIEK
ncbi:MAG: glycine cleavage system aminomethyltransferase GcvT [Thermoprotei archaeon]|nr:MAG: glycine cleavage system aminomethyltransferase GcvT [Thermoprotei archaeon]